MGRVAVSGDARTIGSEGGQWAPCVRDTCALGDVGRAAVRARTVSGTSVQCRNCGRNSLELGTVGCARHIPPEDDVMHLRVRELCVMWDMRAPTRGSERAVGVSACKWVVDQMVDSTFVQY